MFQNRDEDSNSAIDRQLSKILITPIDQNFGKKSGGDADNIYNRRKSIFKWSYKKY